MKKSLLIAILLVVVLASCSFSAKEESLEDPSETKNLVKVSFVPAETKSLESSYQEFVTTYYLTATPKFKRNGRSIVGEVSNEKLAKNQNDDCYNGGYFEQGSWDFQIDAYLEKGQTKTLIASTLLENEYISQKHSKIDVFLEDKMEAGTAKLNVSIRVPKIDEGTDGATLEVYVGETAYSFEEDGPVITVVSETNLTEVLQFDGTIKDVPSGFKNIKFVYKVGDKTISSQNIEVRVVAGVDVLISGSMLNEKYVEGSFNIVYAPDLWDMKVTSDKSEITPSKEGQPAVYAKVSCTITDLPEDSVVSYQWYLDGSIETGSTASTYNFSSKAQGIFTVTCIATVNDFAKSKSVDIYVNNPKK